LIKNNKTGYISPLFHVIYDNWFEMVPNTGQGEMIGGVPDKNVWSELIESSHPTRFVVDHEVEEEGNPLPLPPLHPDWLTADKVDECQNYEMQWRMHRPAQVRDRNRNEAIMRLCGSRRSSTSSSRGSCTATTGCKSNRLIKKFKARFCMCIDMQIEGVDFFDTYAPVVQWSAICLIMIIAVL
jgi:hypothetical protein